MFEQFSFASENQTNSNRFHILESYMPQVKGCHVITSQFASLLSHIFIMLKDYETVFLSFI